MPATPWVSYELIELDASLLLVRDEARAFEAGGAPSKTHCAAPGLLRCGHCGRKLHVR
jgi:hypothetical protein